MVILKVMGTEGFDEASRGGTIGDQVLSVPAVRNSPPLKWGSRLWVKRLYNSSSAGKQMCYPFFFFSYFCRKSWGRRSSKHRNPYCCLGSRCSWTRCGKAWRWYWWWWPFCWSTHSPWKDSWLMETQTCRAHRHEPRRYCSPDGVWEYIYIVLLPCCIFWMPHKDWCRNPLEETVNSEAQSTRLRVQDVHYKHL